MDSFLREINSEAFKAWVLAQTSDDYELKLNPDNPNKITIDTIYAFGEIGFYSLDIIELSVVNKRDGSQEFYLHFQMNTMKHAIDLFNEMIECITGIGDHNATKVLLTCSGGLTTGYFCELLNKKIELFNFNYTFNALPYTKLSAEAKNYDVICLAPQIGYMRDEIAKKNRGKIVFTIPTAVFGKYNAAELISEIHFELENRKKEKEEAKRAITLKKYVEIEHQIMVISSVVHNDKAYIFCRIYDERNEIIFNKEIIKSKLALNDITDTIDMVLLDFPDIQMIGISMPGIINDGKLTLPSDGFNNTDIIGMLETKYQKKIVLSNDINSVAVGYYASQDKYKSLSFLYLAEGRYAGLGNIVNGQLLTGHKSLVGELKFLPYYTGEQLIELSKTKEGCLEIIAKYIITIMTMTGPEAIVINCELLHSVSEIKKEVAKYIEAEYIPDIVIVDDLDEYILLGQMILTVES